MSAPKSNHVVGICVALLVTVTGGAAEGKERAKKGKQGAADAPAQDHAAAALAQAQKHQEEVAAKAAARRRDVTGA